MVLTIVIAVHVGCGVAAVGCGAGAMLTRKGSPRHRRLYLAALAGLGGTAPVLAAVDWAHRWHLAVLGALALGAAAVGFTAVRAQRPTRLPVHITGMSIAYITMLTAFYVDNGPRLPLWNQLPAIGLWLLPAALGAPLLIRALHRHRRRPPVQTRASGSTETAARIAPPGH